jgi:hypothetical protein
MSNALVYVPEMETSNSMGVSCALGSNADQEYGLPVRSLAIH